MCPRTIFAACQPDITGYIIVTSIATGGLGTAAATGTDMIGISMGMKGGAMTIAMAEIESTTVEAVSSMTKARDTEKE
jgi:ABC-type proline/glycine betaine transport system permease subunit